jgi:isopenicillin N synthase-like dioxygenase
MMYHPRSVEDDAKCNNLWSWAHTDYGSLTLLFSQTVSGLQVQMPDGEYRDVRPQRGSIVVNVADTLSFMTKGASVPRVFADQATSNPQSTA